MENRAGAMVQKFNKSMDIALALAVVGVIGLIVLPVPPGMLDLLLVVNISLSVTVLVLTLFTRHVLEFSVFPTLLLLLTLFRLGLNLASTKLILSDGNAGEVINAFAGFVAGNNFVVGAVVFVIIIIIQLLVITSGASRVAEVGARFTLDAMPGKQMAIDADLNAGMIQEEEARARREALQQEADFYGAMDGSSKFVKGDAVAGIVITIINLVGGIAIFVGQRGLGFAEAIDRFGKLTIGDGLVSQVPAVLISVASGILVTRGATSQGFGSQLSSQLFSRHKVLMVTTLLLAVFALVPGFPTLPFLALAVLMGFLSFLLKTDEKNQGMAREEETRQAAAAEARPKTETRVAPRQIDTLSIEISYGLLPLIDESASGDLLERILMVRRQVATDMGIVIAPIRIRDNLQLGPNEYTILIRGNPVGHGEIYVNRFLVMDPGNGEFQVDGIQTVEPTFGLKALWVDEAGKDKSQMYGYTVVDPTTVLVTHLKEIITGHADELIGRQEVQKILDGAKESYSVVIEELIPGILSLGEVQKVLQGLLREGVSIADIGTILETLADYGPLSKDTEILTEYVRHALSRTIAGQYRNSNGKLCVITLSSALEDRIAGSIQKSLQGSFPAIDPDLTSRILHSLNEQLEMSSLVCEQAVVLAAPKIRAAFRNLIASAFPKVGVLSINEVPGNMDLEAVGMVDADDY